MDGTEENVSFEALEKAKRSGPLWNILGSGMMAANTLILNMLVGHFFDIGQVGMFSLALTTSQVLYSVSLFGANDLQMTDYGHRYRFAEYFWLKVFSSLLAAALCIPVLLLSSNRESNACTLLLTLFMLVNSAAELYQSMFFQNGRLDLSGKALFFRYLLSTLAFFALLAGSRSLVLSCAGMLLANLAATLWWILRYEKSFRDSGYAPDWKKEKGLFWEALPLCMSLMGSLLIMNAPKYLIRICLTDQIQGEYNILFMPAYAINLIGQFIYKPFFPRYAWLLRQDGRGFGRLLLSHTALTGIFAVCAGAGVWLVGEPLFLVFFGQDLGAYRSLMPFFVIAGGLLAVNQLLYYIMILLDRKKTIFQNYIAGLVVLLAAGMGMIPRLGIEGALLSFYFGQASLIAGYAASLYRYKKSSGSTGTGSRKPERREEKRDGM